MFDGVPSKSSSYSNANMRSVHAANATFVDTSESAYRELPSRTGPVTAPNADRNPDSNTRAASFMTAPIITSPVRIHNSQIQTPYFITIRQLRAGIVPAAAMSGVARS